jgi:prepilin-type N-terminal cleavage/methylation domain-containing protein
VTAAAQLRSPRISARRGFTFFEVTLVLLILGTVAAALVPVIGNNIRASRLRTAANVLAADLEFAASTCISRPKNPAAVSFDVLHQRYTVFDFVTGAMLKHPMDGQEYVNDFSTGRNAQFADVVLSSVAVGTGSPTTSASITFDAYGKPTLPANLVIVLTYKTQSLTVTVSAATGDVTISG